MKNITLSADDHLIDEARRLARSQKKSLNQVFREWLTQYTASSGTAHNMDLLMKRLGNVRAGRHFTRDEYNAR
jgi:hypothetical protein